MDAAHKTSARLQYGANSALTVELDSDALIADFSAPRAAILSDNEDAIRQALRQPLRSPALDRWTTPGDQIVLAVEEAMPAANVAISVAIQELMRAGIDPDHITVLLGASTRGQQLSALASALPAESGRAVRLVVHDPHDPGQLEFLAVGTDTQPIYLSRTLCDADLVIPIGSLKGNDSYGFSGVAGQVYPCFSGASARRRFQGGERWNRRQRKRHRLESQEVLWLLGPAFTLQTVSAGGDRLLAALAGPIEDVAAAGAGIFEQSWTFQVDRRADLVIAGLSVGPDQQSWSNLARALTTALHAAEEGGAVVLCTDWDVEPGPALRRLAAADSTESAEIALRRHRSVDSAVAQLLLDALQRVRVLLFSRLPAATVEQLGMGAITAVEQISRLTKQYSRCIVLGHAQLAELSVGSESGSNC